MNDPEFCEGCEHTIAVHYIDPRGTVRCSSIESGTSTQGVIELPYSVRCDCKDYQSTMILECRAKRDRKEAEQRERWKVIVKKHFEGMRDVQRRVGRVKCQAKKK